MSARRPRVVVLTGAGISAPSGIATYRGLGSVPGEDRPNDVADLTRRPEAVWAYHGALRRRVAAARPNPAHEALAAAEARADVVVVTQNVDDLHEQAGSTVVHHLHGSLFTTRCDDPGCSSQPFHDTTSPDGVPVCSACGSMLRPDIVMFGERVPRAVKRAVDTAVADADLVLAVGTTLAVTTATSVVRWARDCRVRRVWLTRDPDPDLVGLVDEVHDADVVEGLPPLLERLVGR